MAENMVQGKDPIGTLDEVRTLGLNPRLVGSCSKQTRDNVGCPYHEQCRFHQWRDGVDGRKGPLNIGIEIILGPVDGGAWGQKEMACFQYYKAGLADRVTDSPQTGEVIRVVAYEGDEKQMSFRETVRENPKDPNDKRLLDVIDQRPLRPFERPAKRFPLYAKRENAREQALDEVEREALRAALNRNKPAEVVGKPTKVSGGSS